MTIVVYICPEKLSVYRLDSTACTKILECGVTAASTTELEQLLESPGLNVPVLLVVDLPGDVIVCKSLPNVRHTYKKRLAEVLASKHLGLSLYRLALLNVGRFGYCTDPEVRLFGLGHSLEQSPWYAVLMRSSIRLDGIYCASLLSELACLDTLASHSHVLLCALVGTTWLRFMYFDRGRLRFTRVIAFDSTDERATLDHIENTRRYISSEFTGTDEQLLVTMVTPDVPVAISALSAAETLDGAEVTPSAEILVTTLDPQSEGSTQYALSGSEAPACIERRLLIFLSTVYCPRNLKLLSLKSWCRRWCIHRRLQQRAFPVTAMNKPKRGRFSWERKKSLVITLGGLAALTGALLLVGGGVYARQNASAALSLSRQQAVRTMVVRDLSGYAHDAYLMRDYVQINRALDQRFVVANDLLLGLASIFSRAVGVNLSTLTWKVMDSPSTSTSTLDPAADPRGVLPQNTSDPDGPALLLVRISGHIASNYTSIGEGFSRYSDLTDAIRQQPEFSLWLEERIPFTTGGGSQSLAATGAALRGEFSLFLHYQAHAL